MTSALDLDKADDIDNRMAVLDRFSVTSEPRASTADLLQPSTPPSPPRTTTAAPKASTRAPRRS